MAQVNLGRLLGSGRVVRMKLLSLVAVGALAAQLSAFGMAAPSWAAAAAADSYPRATAAEWAAIANLPDFSGVWDFDGRDQIRQAENNIPPWNPKVAAQMAILTKKENDGFPELILKGCFPHGMPSWMLITHNAMEILLTPGRVTMLGEVDGNRMRRIYTDGRPHPEDPDLSFHGHSIGHWEGDTLVVDTVGIVPQALIATTEGVGAPNNGDMHIVERLRLVDPDTLHDEMEIIAPKVLTKPWKTTRIFHRTRSKLADIVEGQCVRGDYVEGVDADGDAVFIPRPHDEDGVLIVK